MTTEDKDLISQRQAQLILRVNRVTLYRWAKVGKITVYGSDRRNFFSRSELESLMLKPKI